jgi:hypothetical protein
VEAALSLHSAALVDVKLPWTGIRSIEYAGTNTSMARLTATNGDAFAVTLDAGALHVETGFGQTEMPAKLIRSVKVSPAAGAAPAGAVTVRLTIELRDGSHVVGKGLDDSLSFHAPELGDLKLTWTGIRSIEFTGTNTGMARLTATNGDVYQVQFEAPSVKVETSFGKTELPLNLIRSVKVSVSGNAESSSSLVARWPADGNAKDSAGHFDGQISGGLSYVAGPAGGQAFQFDGRDSKVDFGSSTGNFGTNDFTIAFWIKTDSMNSEQAFLSKRVACNGMGKFWEIVLGSGTANQVPPGHLLIQFYDGTGGEPVAEYQDRYELFSNRAINDGLWHHAAWVRQSAGSGKATYLMYLDGALDNSKEVSRAVDLSNQAPLVLGQSLCQGRDATRAYIGGVADLRIFSQALSAEDILGIYNAAAPAASNSHAREDFGGGIRR